MSRFLLQCVTRGDFPGAGWCIWKRGRATGGFVGYRIVTGPVLPVTPETIWDLASLTKPLATTLVALRLSERAAIDLEAPMAEILPELRGARIGAATWADLLTHRSGLPAWKPLYVTCRTLDQAVLAIGATRLAAPARTKIIYSDLGFILLGAALERAAGRDLRTLFRREVARPLGVKDVLYCPKPALARKSAATELGNAHEAGMVKRLRKKHLGFRTRLIWGEVHDHNAYTLGGATGHAGLFGTVPGVLTLARALLEDPPGLLSAATLRRLFMDATPKLEGHRTLGFRLATDPGAPAGPALSRRAVGHSGFTGTSIWIDPEKEAIAVLLTNRMHPTRSHADMDMVRRRFHEVALRTMPRG